MNPAYLYYVNRNYRFHEYAVGSIKSLIRNGGVDPSKIFVRTCVGDFLHEITGQQFLAQYEKLRVNVVDYGNLEHALGGAVSKLTAIAAALREPYGSDGVVMLDADTYLTTKTDLHGWIDKLDALPGWQCATFRDPNPPRNAYTQRLAVQIFQDLAGLSDLSSYRRSMLMRKCLGFDEARFLTWLDSELTWTFGGMWVVRPEASKLRGWSDAVDWQWVMNCDETAAMFLRMLNPSSWLWLDGLGVNHVVNPPVLDFSAEVGGFIHYAGAWYRTKFWQKITEHLLSLE